MSKIRKEVSAVFFNAALELEELESEIRSAVLRIWGMQGAVLVAGVVAVAWVLAHQAYR